MPRLPVIFHMAGSRRADGTDDFIDVFKILCFALKKSNIKFFAYAR
jgi:hypothetical protein